MLKEYREPPLARRLQKYNLIFQASAGCGGFSLPLSLYTLSISARILGMRLFKRSSVDIDAEIHAYTQDVEVLSHLVQIQEDPDTREHMEYNLKVMVLVQQRLLESR